MAELPRLVTHSSMPGPMPCQSFGRRREVYFTTIFVPEDTHEVLKTPKSKG
jgi:hypothetical protein